MPHLAGRFHHILLVWRVRDYQRAEVRHGRVISAAASAVTLPYLPQGTCHCANALASGSSSCIT